MRGTLGKAKTQYDTRRGAVFGEASDRRGDPRDAKSVGRVRKTTENHSKVTSCARFELSASNPWSGLGWSGLGWPGLAWAGLGWAGLGWAGWLTALKSHTVRRF